MVMLTSVCPITSLKLKQYKQFKPTKPQHAPKQLQTVTVDKSAYLDKKATKLIQLISGVFLYYPCAVEPIILPALTDIASAQSQPTEC